MEKKRGTTIYVSREIHQRLCEIGRKKETFDQIIKRLLDLKEEKEKS
jgi:predicted CopG family antitoxin